MKMTLHTSTIHPPPQTHCQPNLSCYGHNFDQTLKVGSGSTITTKQAETEQGQDQLKLRLDYTRFSLVEFGVDLVFMFDGMDMVRFFCFSKL